MAFDDRHRWDATTEQNMRNFFRPAVRHNIPGKTDEMFAAEADDFGYARMSGTTRP